MTRPEMIDTIDPRTMTVTGSVPDMDAEDVAKAVARAREAAAAWSRGLMTHSL